VGVGGHRRDIALTAARGAQAVFLDRDGVLNDLVWDAHAGAHESPLRVDDVRLARGAAQALRVLADAGLPAVVVSNQPSAAKGVVTEAELNAVHDRVLTELAGSGGQVLASYLCLHHPDGRDPRLGGLCDCRKPAPGLLTKAAADHGLDLTASWLVGDTDADVGAAAAAGLAGMVLVEHPRSAHRRGRSAHSPDARAADALEAVRLVVARLRA
jgi:D-glycero-D-manno-heptose 1,7-bisphosphate phosphatase